jgi:hypothetical protein
MAYLLAYSEVFMYYDGQLWIDIRVFSWHQDRQTASHTRCRFYLCCLKVTRKFAPLRAGMK